MTIAFKRKEEKKFLLDSLEDGQAFIWEKPGCSDPLYCIKLIEWDEKADGSMIPIAVLNSGMVYFVLDSTTVVPIKVEATVSIL